MYVGCGRDGWKVRTGMRLKKVCGGGGGRGGKEAKKETRSGERREVKTVQKEETIAISLKTK